MEIVKNPGKEKWFELLKRPARTDEEIQISVREILKDVRKNRDRALKKYTKALDNAYVENFRINKEEFENLSRDVGEDLKQAIIRASGNIEKFHKAQMPETVTVDMGNGLTCWQKPVPVESVGIYVPGGSAPLFSSVLMMAVPAKLAGCNSVYLATPPDSSGNINPAIVYAAMISGVDAIFKVGGAQAIAAFAYGTESVPQVNKIFGPGNQYVTLAKQMVNAEGVAIDMPAGPSEVLVVADSATPADYVAADLLAQAEHGADSQVLFLTEEEKMLEKVNESVTSLMNELPRKDLVEKSLESSKLILLENNDKIMEMVNEYAPEHLILACENADEMAEKVVNAGSVFIGRYTPESLGDYSSGTNHVLPTGGAAKGYSGVNIDSFMKKITFQKAEKSGLEDMAATTMEMAKAEGLEAHRKAVEIRLATKKQLL